MKAMKGILVVMKANRFGNIYNLEGRTYIDHATVAYKGASDCTHLWHPFLGHMSEKGLKVLVNRKILPRLKYLNFNFYEHCIYGKKYRHVSKGIPGYSHSDIWGPYSKVSFGGSSYFVKFIDDYSRKVWTYLVKIKADVFDVFNKYRLWLNKALENQLNV